jgi:enolase-phosphatase E1
LHPPLSLNPLQPHHPNLNHLQILKTPPTNTPQFPYALHTLPSVLATDWDSPTFLPYRQAFPPEHSTSPSALRSHVEDLMSHDLKIPYLKGLQGYLWLRGYESGVLKCPLFGDVAPSMRSWREMGKKIVIYSSGSVAAQKLLFQYTTEKEEKGDLRYLVDGWYDTVNAGGKNEGGSYRKIVEDFAGKGEGKGEREMSRWLFLSDNVKEVRAAKSVGMKSFVVVREGNKELTEGEKEGEVLVNRFDEIKLS